MRRFKIVINTHSLCYDKDYGIEKRSGWSVCYDGSFLSDLQPFFKSIYTAYKSYKMIKSDELEINA